MNLCIVLQTYSEGENNFIVLHIIAFIRTIVPITIGFEKSESRLLEGDAVEICVIVEDGDVTHSITITVSTSSSKSGFNSNGNLPDYEDPYLVQAIGKFSTSQSFNPSLVSIVLWFCSWKRLQFQTSD